jgi:hypothetical protein
MAGDAAPDDIGRLVERVGCTLAARQAGTLVRVVNATGVVLHTNLGRAPLAPAAARAVAGLASGYSNLELDLGTGKRGSRAVHAAGPLARLTGAESAVVVNNGAAAILLVLASLARDAEVIVSRGELIEIGGSFRLHEVIAQSGARLIEVGTTNKILVSDLHTPQRWYNMLRIFRRTSPMSIGSYVLTAFGAFSALSLFPKIGRLAQVPAALAGAGMASYTPAFLASTASPLWSAAPRALGAEFATAAFASGAAALMLCSREPAVERLACVATLVYGASAFAVKRELKEKRVDRPLKSGRTARMHKAGLGLAIALPLACFALNAVAGRSRSRSTLGAAGILAGVFLSRWALFEAGNESARSAEDYLRLRSGDG